MPKLPKNERPRGERDVLADVRRELSRLRIVHWRNNVGMLRDERGIPLRYGLCEGSADIIAIVQVWPDTRDSVCHLIGRFVAIECKHPTRKNESREAEQRQWGELVERNGGIYAVVHDASEIEVVIRRAQEW